MKFITRCGFIVLIFLPSNLPTYGIAQVNPESTVAKSNTSTSTGASQSLAVEQISNPTTTDNFTKSSVTDKFDALRLYRNGLVYAVQNLTTKIQNSNEKLKESQQNLATLDDSEPKFRYPSKDALTNEQKRLNEFLQSANARLDAAEKLKLTETDIEKLRAQVSSYRANLGNLDEEIANYDENLKKFTNQKAEWDSRRDAMGNLIADIQTALPVGAANLASLNRQLSEADEKIASLFGQNDASNKFKTTMSEVFAGLVALVIIGFFFIAVRDNTVRRAIFSNESGIQFITLFALVIAIILFGIVDILEGKELAALLGGLSGYILGRGTARPGGGEASTAAAHAGTGYQG
jgi:predicted  nucleic acid-binding Zn-ribbon protein